MSSAASQIDIDDLIDRKAALVEDFTRSTDIDRLIDAKASAASRAGLEVVPIEEGYVTAHKHGRPAPFKWKDLKPSLLGKGLVVGTAEVGAGLVRAVDIAAGPLELPPLERPQRPEDIGQSGYFTKEGERIGGAPFTPEERQAFEAEHPEYAEAARKGGIEKYDYEAALAEWKKTQTKDTDVDRATDWIRNLPPEEWKKELEEAAAGPLFEFSAKAANAWMANLSRQAPIFLAMWAAKIGGTAVAGPAGGVTAGLGTMSGLEAASFYDAGKRLGLDDSVNRKYSKYYGAGSGPIEYAQMLWVVGRITGKNKLPPEVRRAVAKALMTAGGLVWEGVEEYSQNALQNWLMQKAIAEHNAIHPDEQITDVPEIGEGGLRAFALGVGFATVASAGGRAVKGAAETIGDVAEKREHGKAKEAYEGITQEQEHDRQEQERQARPEREGQEPGRAAQEPPAGREPTEAGGVLQGAEGEQVGLTLREGDFVQWEIEGREQFDEPTRVTKVSKDGRFVFVEGQEAGIPAEDITTIHQPRAGRAEVGGEIEAPRPGYQTPEPARIVEDMGENWGVQFEGDEKVYGVPKEAAEKPPSPEVPEKAPEGVPAEKVAPAPTAVPAEPAEVAPEAPPVAEKPGKKPRRRKPPAPTAKTAKLAEEIVSQWESESGLSREPDIEVGPAAPGEPSPATPSTTFYKKIPGEVLDHFTGGERLRMRKFVTVTQTRGWAGGEDYMSEIGPEAFVAEIRRMMAGKKGVTADAVANAKEWARGTGSYELYSKIVQYENALADPETIGEYEEVNPKSLKVGDTFTIGDEKFTVTDKDAENITAKDGVESGLDLDDKLLIDKGSLVQAKPPKRIGLFGKEIIEPISGEQGDLGLAKEKVAEKAVGEVEITDALDKAVREDLRDAQESGLSLEGYAKTDPEDIYWRVREDAADIRALFKDEANWKQEIHEAVERATKGRALFKPAPAEAKPKRITSQEAYDKAKANIKGKLGPTTLRAGLDPTILKDLAVVGLYHFENAVRAGAAKFEAWAKAMQAEYGENVKPYLRTVWMRSAKERARVTDIFKSEQKAQKKSATPSAVKKRLLAQAQVGRGPDVTMTTHKLLDLAMRKAAAGARGAWLKSAENIIKEHTNIAEYIRTRLGGVVSQADLNRILRLVTQPRTRAELRRAVAAAELFVEAKEKRQAIAELKKAQTALDLKHITPALRTKAEALFDTFTVSVPSDKLLRRMNNLIAAKELDELGEIPQKLIERAKEHLRRAERTPLASLTAEQIRDITRAIQSITKANAVRNTLFFGQAKRTAKEEIGQATDEVRERHGQKYKIPAGQYSQNRVIGAIKKILGWMHVSSDTMAFMLGGENSTTYRLLDENLHEGQNTTLKIQDNASDYFIAKLKEAGLTHKQVAKWSNDMAGGKGEIVTTKLPTATNEQGGRVETIEMTKAERVELLAHLMDGDTRAQILRDSAKGITFRRMRGGEAVKLRIDDVAAIEKAATPEEVLVAKAMREYLNSELRDTLNKAWVDEHGYEIAIRHDYWPRQRDADFRETDPSKIMQFWVSQQLDHQGIYKPRTSSTAPVLIGDAFTTFFTHVNRTAAYVGKSRPSNDAMRLLKDLGFRRSVMSAFRSGPSILGDMEDMIRDYRGLEMARGSAIEHAARALTRKAHVAILAAKGHIVAYQTASLVTALAEIDAKYLFDVTHWKLVGNKEIRQEMREYSPFLNARLKGSGHQIVSPGAVGGAIDSFYGGREGVIDLIGMKPIHVGDSQVMYLLWQAAKAEAKDKGFEGEALLKETARRAEVIVRRTQPTWDVTTLSAMGRAARKNALLKLMTMFASQRMKNMNISIRAASEFAHSEKKPADYARLTKKLALANIVNAMLIYGLQLAYFRLLSGPPDEEKEKGWGAYAMGVLQRLFGNWVFVGDFASELATAVKNGIEGKPSIFAEHRANPLAQAATDAIQGAHLIAQASSEAASNKVKKSGRGKGDPKWESTAMRAFVKSTRFLGIVTGLPTHGPLLMADKLSDRFEEEKPKPKPKWKKKKKAASW